MLPTIAGYAATWNEPTGDYALRGETVTFERGAFLASIAGRNSRPIPADYRVLAMLHHDVDTTFAAMGDGLELFEDAVGLGFRITPWDTFEGRYAAECVRLGVLKGASVRIMHHTSERGTLRDGVRFARCRTAGLLEISLCYRGANPRTTVALWG